MKEAKQIYNQQNTVLIPPQVDTFAETIKKTTNQNSTTNNIQYRVYKEN